MANDHVHDGCNHSAILQDVARQAMIDRGLAPDFSAEAEKQAEAITDSAHDTDASIKDLRNLIWCSIDNDDSRDLDQLTVAEDLGGGNTRAMVAVADVDAIVRKGSPIDDHARQNTTSVYTAARIFPMLPENLSTNLTSLNEHEERIAIVMDMVIAADGSVTKGDVYRARVHNKAQLAYNAVGMWLEGKGDMPAKVKAVPGLAENLKLQDHVADAMRELRHEHGALDLDTIEARAVMKDGHVVDLEAEARNNAKNLIEDFMIAANGVTARFLTAKGFSGLRRVVRSPERWDRIEAIAAKYGEKLPADPDSVALEEFLVRRRKADPLRFPDLSLAIVKAMGAGEYIVERPGEASIGHFGLAVRDYTHSTAPNRRFPDLITHRLIKPALAGGKAGYTDDELSALAQHCTEAEDAANKVERQVRKSAAACILEPRVGQRFDGIVTGASEKGTWVRVFHPPVEGKVIHGAHGVDVGDRVNVKLVDVNVERGYIDFVR
ncbi:MAG TPA: RNB domain-containing ribonuclease [Thermoanaerobaculia bacterium]|jgi:VacB/RNase II family 3'-5' exoribonuclease|nr:RNB domain-containing ribonuclease [Thermoanaerobaculia bacterium]